MSSDVDITVVTDDAGRPVRAAGPGLVDLQLNGYAGLSFKADPEAFTVQAIRSLAEKVRRRGVVSFLATITTAPTADVIARAARLAELRGQDELIAEMIGGFHIEGPMISPEDGPRGAHPREHVIAPADEPDFVARLQEATGGLVKILTLAPELPGAMEMIAAAAEGGVVVALGHHQADAEVLERAVRAGASMCTHLGNGSHAMLPRLDNYLQRQLADDRLVASFIADGRHLPYPTLKNFIRAKGLARSVLITDAVAAADAPDDYRLPEGRQMGPDGVILLAGTPYLSGTAVTLDRAVLNTAANCDVSFQQAWSMASVQPAELVGLDAPQRVEVDITDGGFSLRR